MNKALEPGLKLAPPIRAIYVNFITLSLPVMGRNRYSLSLNYYYLFIEYYLDSCEYLLTSIGIII